jgi:Putative Ser protein kinase
MSDGDTLSRLSKEHKEQMPEDLRVAKDFRWYLEEVVEKPKIARSAHQRFADMFDYYGTEVNDSWGIMEYKMVSEDPLHDGENVFFGREVHHAIHDFVNKIKSGARGLGPEKRIKLLLGPVGSGKSAFDKMVRKYFEDYTLQEAGKMYTFRWTNLCDIIGDQDPSDNVVRSPMNQDPLLLLSQSQRNQILDDMNANLDAPYTIRNEQELDPESEFYLDSLLAHYDDDLEQVLENHIEVIRLTANENKRQCIETFEPKDKKNQDETELTGDVNYSKLALYGESDPRAFDYGGAFCNANRGLFSGEELLKLQREFLYDFLHASQEKTIKPKNNPRIDIDQIIVGRTNLPEYQDKRNDDKMEAFMDRTERVDFPYILSYKDESGIHEKHISNADIPEIHIEPHTYDMTSLFAVLSRIYEPAGRDITILQKALSYNGTGDDDIDVDKLREEAKSQGTLNEGMFGISSRVTSDEISAAIMDETLSSTDDFGVANLFPLTILDYLEDNLENRGSVDEEKMDTYMEYLEIVRDEYEKRAVEDVREALAYDPEEIQTQGEKYLDHVMAYIDDDTVVDEVTGHDTNPDETFLRSVEEKLDIPNDRKDDFRQEVSNWVSRRARKGKSFNPSDNERLQRALEKKIWQEKKHNINFGSLISSGDIEEEEDSNTWIRGLMEKGYSQQGAKDVLEFAGAIVAKQELE